MKLNLKAFAFAFGLASPFLAQNAQAEGRLTVYCTVQQEACEGNMKIFSEKYGVKTQFIHGSTGTILGKLKAEKDNPQADVWFGGTIEPHFQAGQLGLLETYRSPTEADLLPQFKSVIDKYGDKTAVTYMLLLGFGVNTEKLQQLGVPVPKTWDDLLDPRLKGEIQIADPRSSGTAYTILATLIQTMGEEKAYEYLHKLNANVSQYVKSNLVTSNLSRGESAVTIGFIHAYQTEKERGAKVDWVLPEGKLGYALGGTSILKNARNLDNAKKFVDFVLSKEMQEYPWRQLGVYQISANAKAELPKNFVNPKNLDLLDFDFAKFGSPEEAKRLIDKWLADIKLAK